MKFQGERRDPKDALELMLVEMSAISMEIFIRIST